MVRKIYEDINGRIFETTSFNDIINALDNVQNGIRISLNTNNNTFIYADMNKFVHAIMLMNLIKKGYFSDSEKNIEIKDNSELSEAIENGIIKPIYNFGITNKKSGVQAFLSDSYTQAIKYNNGLFALMLRPDYDPFKSDFFKQVMSKYKKDDEVNSQINEVLQIAGVPTDNLKGYKRVAGFYHLNDGDFEIFTREDPKDKEELYTDKYSHNIYEDDLEEFNLVRFGIEDLGKITCYIEATNKSNAYKCKKAIERKFYEIPIEKFELEYMDENNEYCYEEKLIQ